MLSVIALTACNKINDTTARESQLSFEEFCLSDQLGYPVQILVHDSVIYISDIYGDTLVHKYSCKDGRPIGKTIPKGVGPGEVLPPIQMQAYDDTLMVYARPILTMFKGAFADNARLQRVATMPGVTSNAWRINDDEYIVSTSIFGNNDIDNSINNRFLLLDRDMNIKQKFGEFPKFWSAEKNFDASTLSNFHQTMQILPLSSDSIVAVTNYVMSFYNRDSEGNFVLSKELRILPYEYDMRPPTERTSAQTKIKPEYTTKIYDARIFNNNIVLGITDKTESNDSTNLYFITVDYNGETQFKYMPDKKIDPPFYILDSGHILSIARDDDDDKTYIVKSTTAIE